jgi:predicted  nucleic acid-binding Zn-ribbon protein
MKKIFLLATILLLSVACTDSSNKTNIETLAETDYVDSKMGFAAAKRSARSKPVPPKSNQFERKLIKTGNLNFETQDLSKTKSTIEGLVKSFNGYIANDNEYKSYDRISNTISLRIPASKFDEFIIEISKGVEKFDSKNINISDVTEQFLDVEARLKTKKALESKYLEILKKTKSVREILDVERELGKLRADIESTEGRLKYLKNQTSFSTLNITFYKKIIASDSSFGGKITEAFKDGFDNIKAFFLFLINIWPFIIILFLVFFYFRKRRKSRTKS